MVANNFSRVVSGAIALAIAIGSIVLRQNWNSPPNPIHLPIQKR